MEVICIDNECCCEKMCTSFNKKLHSRLGYLFLNVFAFLLAFFVGLGDKYENSINSISFSLAVFHLLIIIISLFGTNVTIPLNRSFWSLKFIIILGLYLLSYLAFSDKFFEGYTKLTKYVSVGFLVYMCFLIITFGHFLNNRLFTNLEILESQNLSSAKYQSLLWGLTILFYGIAIMFYIFIFDTSLKNHGFTFVAALVGAIATIVVSFMSISPLVERKRLLTSALIAFYVAYLIWSARFANNDEDRTNLTKAFDIIVGSVFMLTCLIFLAITIKKVKLQSEEDKSLARNPFIEADDGTDADVTTTLVQKESGQEVEVYVVTRSYFLYQGFLLFLSVFYSMHFTNWNTYKDSDDEGGFGFWIKVVASFLTLGLYIWVLIAPRLFPDREFAFV